jgi:hypothetical protein
MDFKVETEKITTNTIDKFIDFLLGMLSPVKMNNYLLQILLGKMRYAFTCFNEKFNMSFSQIVCMLWMLSRIKDALRFQRELQNISPFTVLAYLYCCFIIFFKFLFDEDFSIKGFSNIINPEVKKLIENERIVLLLLKYDLYPSELEFALHKGLLI